MPAECRMKSTPLSTVVISPSIDSKPAWASGKLASVNEPPAREGMP